MHDPHKFHSISNCIDSTKHRHPSLAPGAVFSLNISSCAAHKRVNWTSSWKRKWSNKRRWKILWPENGKNALCSSVSIFFYSSIPFPQYSVSSWENYSEFQRNYVLQVLPHVDDVNVRKLVNFLTSLGDAVLCTYRKLSHKRVENECGELAWLCVICAALWKDPEKHFHHLSFSLSSLVGLSQHRTYRRHTTSDNIYDK